MLALLFGALAHDSCLPGAVPAAASRVQSWGLYSELCLLESAELPGSVTLSGIAHLC